MTTPGNDLYDARAGTCAHDSWLSGEDREVMVESVVHPSLGHLTESIAAATLRRRLSDEIPGSPAWVQQAVRIAGANPNKAIVSETLSSSSDYEPFIPGLMAEAARSASLAALNSELVHEGADFGAIPPEVDPFRAGGGGGRVDEAYVEISPHIVPTGASKTSYAMRCIRQAIGTELQQAHNMLRV